MSMKHYGCYDFGVAFVFDDLDKQKARRELCEDYGEHEWNESILFDFFDATWDCTYYGSDYIGTAYLVKDGEETILPEWFAIGRPNRCPGFFSQAYKDYDELKEELMHKFGKYLRDDFPWEKRIVEFIGVVRE